MTPTRKLRASVALFALALLLVAVAAASEAVVPLFAAWVPLALIPWVLTRPGPDWERQQHSPAAGGEERARAADDSSPTNGEGTS